MAVGRRKQPAFQKTGEHANLALRRWKSELLIRSSDHLRGVGRGFLGNLSVFQRSPKLTLLLVCLKTEGSYLQQICRKQRKP